MDLPRRLIAISSHMSVHIRAFYEQISAAYNGVEDPPARLGIKLEIQLQNFDPVEPGCDHHRYHSRRLQLHDPETLPDLPFVSRVTIRSRSNGSNAETARDIRPLSPLVLLQYLVHLPALQEWNTPWLWERPMPASMPIRGPTEPDPSAAKDSGSVGLCKLGEQLRRAVVTSDLFPSPAASTDQQWSQMQRFRLEIHSLRPDGRWYFVGPGGEDPHDPEQGGYEISDTDEGMDLLAQYDDHADEDEYDYHLDMFRTEPCRERIEPLLAAFAKSLTRDNMSSLEDAEIFTHVWWYPSDDREVK